MAKQRHNAKRKTYTPTPPQAPKSSLKHDLLTALLKVLGLVLVYVIQFFLIGNHDYSLNTYLSSQASVVTFYANALAIFSTTYGKATADFDVSGTTYLLSMFGYLLVAHIFAQAIFMVYPEIKLYAEFMRSKWICIIGNLALFGIIFAISCSKGITDYSKETLNYPKKASNRKA